MKKIRSNSKYNEVGIRKRRKRIKHIIAVIICMIIAIMSAFISFGMFGDNAWDKIYSAFGLADFSKAADAYPLSVSFIDVGDGDSILIECSGRAALIDSGALSIDGTAVEYIKKRGVEKLDFIICTHPDDDHIGDMKSIFESFDVGKCYVTRLSEDKETDSKNRISETLKYSGITPQVLRCGTCIELGEMNIEVIAPLKIYEESNNNSIVLRAVYGDISFLFTGDCEYEAEKDILASGKNIKSTILKVAHHGSKTSTSEEFLNSVSPEIAVISVGDKNKYLPSRETVSRLESFGCEILRTDDSGTIILASDGKKIFEYKEKQ